MRFRASSASAAREETEGSADCGIRSLDGERRSLASGKLLLVLLLKIPVLSLGLSGLRKASKKIKKPRFGVKCSHKTSVGFALASKSSQKESGKIGLASINIRWLQSASKNLRLVSAGFSGLQSETRKASANPLPFLSLDRQAAVILVSGGGSRMTHKTLDEALEEAVQKLMEVENALNTLGGAESYRYAKIAFAAFDRIGALQGRGIRLIKICQAFEESGLLPQNANPRCFCQAFRREKARRGKSADSSIAPTVQAEKPNAAKTSMPAGNARGSESREAAPGEKTVKVAGTAVNTALGKLTKHSDGSFDFDWK
jgi:hypothetical protein